MGKKEVRFTSKKLKRARRILSEVVELLERHKIDYHLEGGTLLGIVRDIEAGSLLELKIKFFFKGYKISIRRSHKNVGPIKVGDYSILKVKPIFHYLLYAIYPKAKENLIVLDVFIKASDESYTCWQAKGKVMRVDNKYYKSFESIRALGKDFRIPNQYKEYLTEKYGDWSVPIKEWCCSKNGETIIGDV